MFFGKQSAAAPAYGQYMPAGYPPRVQPVGPGGMQAGIPPQAPGAAMPEMFVQPPSLDPEALRKQLVGSATAAVPMPDVPQLSFAPPPKPPPVPINLSNLDRLMLTMYGQGQIGQGGTPMSSTRPAYIPEGYQLRTTSLYSDPRSGVQTTYGIVPIGGAQYTYPTGGRPLFFPSGSNQFGR